MKIVGECIYLDVKRLYLRGICIYDTCPKCKKDVVLDMADNYPYNLQQDGTCTISIGCNDCEEFWDKSLKLRITLT